MNTLSAICVCSPEMAVALAEALGAKTLTVTAVEDLNDAVSRRTLPEVIISDAVPGAYDRIRRLPENCHRVVLLSSDRSWRREENRWVLFEPKIHVVEAPPSPRGLEALNRIFDGQESCESRAMLMLDPVRRHVWREAAAACRPPIQVIELGEGEDVETRCGEERPDVIVTGKDGDLIGEWSEANRVPWLRCAHRGATHRVELGTVVENASVHDAAAALCSALQGRHTNFASPVDTRAHVLLVDDMAASCRVVARMLDQSAPGVRVTHAYNGLAALAAIERDRPDVLMIDDIMPGCNGTEVVEKARAAGWLTKTEVLFSSGYLASPAERYRRLQPIAIMLLPVAIDAFRRAIFAAFAARGIEVHGGDPGPPAERGSYNWVREDVPEELLYS